MCTCMTHLRDIDTPSLASLQAAATTSCVRRFSVPFRSFLLSRSNTPHAQPWGMPSTVGRSSKSGTVNGIAYAQMQVAELYPSMLRLGMTRF
jgi:hypothetical protein